MRGLRTEKPWRGCVGPGFNSRQLHNLTPLTTLVSGVFTHLPVKRKMQKICDVPQIVTKILTFGTHLA